MISEHAYGRWYGATLPEHDVRLGVSACLLPGSALVISVDRGVTVSAAATLVVSHVDLHLRGAGSVMASCYLMVGILYCKYSEEHESSQQEKELERA